MAKITTAKCSSNNNNNNNHDMKSDEYLHEDRQSFWGSEEKIFTGSSAESWWVLLVANTEKNRYIHIYVCVYTEAI